MDSGSSDPLKMLNSSVLTMFPTAQTQLVA
jgi:hypothetical protein